MLTRQKEAKGQAPVVMRRPLAGKQALEGPS